MDRHDIKLLNRALLDLDEIYAYIAKTLLLSETAAKLINEIEEAIFSLMQMPHRGSELRYGAHADKGYWQLFVKNYTIVYRIDAEKKQVIIVTVRYSSRNL